MRTATYAGDKPKRLLYFLQGGAFACIVLLLALCGYLLLVAAGWVYRQPLFFSESIFESGVRDSGYSKD